MTHRTSRRSFLNIAGLATGGLLLQRTLFGGTALAADPDPKFFLMVYFSGGWDQLLALDPRDATLPQYTYVGGNEPTSGIEPAYARSVGTSAQVASVMTATSGRGVQSAGNLTFGPAVTPELLAHAPDLSIIRGISMDTVTHEVGRRYLITGKFPRGTSASGSSLNTVFAGRNGSTLDLPNLTLGVESYNDGFDAVASAIGVESAADVQAVLTAQSQSPGLLISSEEALGAFESNSDTCEAHGYDASGLVSAFRSSRMSARRMTQSTSAQLFDFRNPPPNPEVAQLFTEMNIDPKKELNSSKSRAAIAAQAITHGVSQVVAVSLANGLDDHFDLGETHASTQAEGFQALGLLIKYLKSKEYGTSGKSYWAFTSLMCFSEFGRTPLVNVRDGRDHHLTGSCLVAGPGIKGGTVLGATSEAGMGILKWNLETGAQDPSGKVIRPPDIHASLLRSMSLDYSHLSNQSPQMLSTLLK